MRSEARQNWAFADLPLHKLLSQGRKVRPEDTHQNLRIAVLGDAATQHYQQALSANLRLRGIWPDIFEAEFDMLHQEIRDENSALYKHRPDIIVLFTTTQALWSRFSISDDKAKFGENEYYNLADLWEEIRKHSNATIIQHNFVVPLNRPFGNTTGASPDTFVAAISKLNYLLATGASSSRIRLVDTEFQAAYFGKRHWFDERLWCQARQALSPSFLPPLAKSVVDIMLVEQGFGVKCVVVDLDNTIWGGILADDGIDRIEIGQAELGLAFSRFQLFLMELRSRGVLLAACSKNHQENVLQVFENHPDMLLRTADFAVIVANYQDKVSNIMHIRETLGIGYEGMVFLDDTAFERELVRSALPAIEVPELPDDPAAFLSEIARWNLFEGRMPTAEDLRRNLFYQDNSKRLEIRQKFAGVDEFIADLAMQAEFLPINGFTLPRALQLVQRSNQFNLTTIRHTESALRDLASNEDSVAFCIRLRDRLGDNGVIAIVVIRREGTDAIVDTWIMSCRVLGRKVEDITIGQIVNGAKRLGCDRIVGQYIPTPKNAMVADIYLRHGFQKLANDGELQLFSLSVEDYVSTPVPIAIHVTNETIDG